MSHALIARVLLTSPTRKPSDAMAFTPAELIFATVTVTRWLSATPVRVTNTSLLACVTIGEPTETAAAFTAVTAPVELTVAFIRNTIVCADAMTRGSTVTAPSMAGILSMGKSNGPNTPPPCILRENAAVTTSPAGAAGSTNSVMLCAGKLIVKVLLR